MTPRDLTVVWAGVQALHVVSFIVAWVQTLGKPDQRLPVTIAAVPAMFGTLVFVLFVQTWVVGDSGTTWDAGPEAFVGLWYRWWWWLVAGSPIVLGLGLVSLRMKPRRPFSLAARLTGIASCAIAVVVLAMLPAFS